LIALLGCSRERHFLGFDTTSDEGLTADTPDEQDAGPRPPSHGGPSAGTAGSGGGGGGAEGGSGGEFGAAGEGGAATGGGGAAGESGDPNGDGGAEPEPEPTPEPEPEPEVDAGSGAGGVSVEVPNHIVDVLGSAPAAVERRVEEVFQQLFHGDEDSESIYVEVGDGSAYIHDVYHDDTRADALGMGLLITVLLDKPVEFDAIWSFTSAHLRYAEGPNAGYFHATCHKSGDPCADVGVFGSFHVVTALLLAEARWGNEGAFDYGSEARDILETFRTKETQNGGIVEGVINIFGTDPLPNQFPVEETAGQASPGSLMPGYFQYWGERTGDGYWHDAAVRARELLRVVVNPDNGLTPDLVYFDGTFVDGYEDFREPAYNVAFNIAVDTAWYDADPEQIEMANARVRFFHSFGGSYPSLFTYDGEPVPPPNPSGALVALNGVAAGIATIPARDDFIRTVADTPIQTGHLRYFDGINQLLALMYLAGYVKPYY
jgi:endo-1,4-beta-D-glucanase Y